MFKEAYSNIDQLAELLSNRFALPILVSCNNSTYPVSYDEIWEMLNDEWGTRNKKEPLEPTVVKSQLRFLVRQKFLRVEEESGKSIASASFARPFLERFLGMVKWEEKTYQITPRGVQAAIDLSPQAREGIHHSFMT